MQLAQPNNEHKFLKGGGEMGRLIRSRNWSQTPLGSLDSWPQSLRTTLSIILHSKFPMFLFWGQDLLCFYNDAYRPSLGNDGKHPNALGKPGADVWPEIWDAIKPIIDQVLAGGEANWSEDQLLPIYRNGELEEVYWTFSYSPVTDESDQIAGVFVTCTETTQKVNNIKQLEESKDQLAFAIDATELGTWDLNPTTNKFTANARLKEWFGLKPDDEVPLPLATNVIAEKDRQRVNNAIWYALQYISGGQYDIDYTIINPITKKERIVKAKGKAWFNDEQAAYRFNGTLQDITEQKLAEQALAESEQSLRSLIASAPFPIGVYVGRQMRIQFANQSIIDVWGKGPDVVGKLYTDILPELSNQAIFNQLDDVYMTGVAFHARGQQVDIVVDGKLQPYYFNYSFTPLYDADGQVYGVMNTAAEITDLVLAKQQVEDTEAALRGAVELAELGTWQLDLYTGITEFSERLRNWFGIGPDDIITPERGYLSIREADRPRVQAATDHATTPGTDGVYDVEFTLDATQTGQERIIHAQGKAYLNQQGEIYKLSGTAQDVTKQRKIQVALEQQVQERTEELEASNEELAATIEELAATNEELAATNEELTAASEEITVANKGLEESNLHLTRSNQNLEQFAYIASHDLQEPLRKIQQFGDLLKIRYANSSGEELVYLERMQSAASRMSLLIRDLLAFSRISTGQATAVTVPLSQVVDEVLENLSVVIGETNTQLQIGPLPIVQGDASQLGQLFQNLLSNAIKFSRQDQAGNPVVPHVTLSASKVLAQDLPASLKPGRQAIVYHQIKVADNGIGFDEKYTNRIFQVFQRLHGKNEFAGTGVGLAICEKVVTNHGGAITATSQPGQGAIFSVYLPA